MSMCWTVNEHTQNKSLLLSFKTSALSGVGGRTLHTCQPACGVPRPADPDSVEGEVWWNVHVQDYHWAHPKQIICCSPSLKPQPCLGVGVGWGWDDTVHTCQPAYGVTRPADPDSVEGVWWNGHVLTVTEHTQNKSLLLSFFKTSALFGVGVGGEGGGGHNAYLSPSLWNSQTCWPWFSRMRSMMKCPWTLLWGGGAGSKWLAVHRAGEVGWGEGKRTAPTIRRFLSPHKLLAPPFGWLPASGTHPQPTEASEPPCHVARNPWTMVDWTACPEKPWHPS